MCSAGVPENKSRASGRLAPEASESLMYLRSLFDRTLYLLGISREYGNIYIYIYILGNRL